MRSDGRYNRRVPVISMRASVAVHVIVAVLALSASPANAEPKPAAPGSLDLPCRQDLKGSWRIVGSRDGIATLDDWCQSVGPPAVRHVTREERSVRRIAIVSWNVHV